MSKPLIIALFGAAVCLAGCSETDDIFRSERTTFSDSELSSVDDCLRRFSASRGEWSNFPVRASFVYDLTDLGPDEARAFWKSDPADSGKHTSTIHRGDGSLSALKNFLENEPQGDTELLDVDGHILFRVNEGIQPSFETALQKGCERLRDGIGIRQVKFSRGIR